MTLEEAFNQVPEHLGVGLFRQPTDGSPQAPRMRPAKYQAVITVTSRAFSGPIAVVDSGDPVKALDEAWQRAKAKLQP